MTASPEENRTLDGVQLEVYRHLFTAVAEEMGAALRRASYSPNIKERRDYSCAVFSPATEPVAMGDHMPVHLGAMPMSVEAALEELGALGEGDVALVNDPFKGGTHLPDITAISAIRTRDGTLVGYVAARAHHSDVGGMSPGSMPLSTDIFQEGLRIPPVLLYRAGIRNDDLWKLILTNVRTPDERSGDLDASLAALHTGRSRILELCERRGTSAVLVAMDALVEHADRLLEAGVERIPDGMWTARDSLEDDGAGSGPVPIQVTLSVEGCRLRVDFTGTSPQVAGGVNAVSAITSSAVRYVIRCVVEDLLGAPVPAGGGSLRSVELVAPLGTVVNARPPAGVAAGNVETSQRITDVLIRAFQQALPGRMPALSQGTMNNITVGGIDPRTGSPFAYYETVGGGMGGGAGGPGLDGVHSHMSNSLNTPVEALEHAYPFRVRRYELRRGSGGAGLHGGGDGLRRDLELLTSAEVTILSERRLSGPDGAHGGHAGLPGRNEVFRVNGSRESLAAKVRFRVEAGDVVSIRSPGGGGWGHPTGGSPSAAAERGEVD